MKITLRSNKEGRYVGKFGLLTDYEEDAIEFATASDAAGYCRDNEIEATAVVRYASFVYHLKLNASTVGAMSHPA